MNETKPKLMTDVVSWVSITLLSLAAFYLTYAYHFSGPIQALIWLGWFIAFLAIGFFTTQGRQVYLFAQEAKIELQKVTWATRQETIQTTSIVMIMVAVTGFVLWGVDSGMMWIIGKITHLG